MKSFLRSLSQSVKSLGSSKTWKVLTKPSDAQASSPNNIQTSELAVGDGLITQSLNKRNSSTELIDTVNELSSQSQEINSDPQPSNGISMAINVAKSGMAFIKEASAAFPPLHGIAAGLLFVLEHHEKWVANKEDVKRLAKRLESLRSSLETTQGDSFQNAHTEKLMRELQNLAHVLEGLKARSRVESYVAADSDKEVFSSLVEDIRDSVMEYQTAIQTEILETTMKIVASEDDRILRTLIHAGDASHRSKQHGACLSGTRTAMLHTIDVWAEDPISLPVYWLNGHAGSGKSTIAQSFCHRAYANGQLGASFFCSRDSAERSNLHMIFPTLSFQLAYRYSAFKDHLIQTLKEHPDIARESLDHQLSKLLVQPLKNANLSTILVIDALDECKDNEPESAILTLLSCHIHEVPLIKFFITGRPETPLRNGFRLLGLQAVTKICFLHSLSRAVKRRSDVDLPSPWPSNEDIRALMIKSERLFIFAATAVSFITSSPVHQPNKRLMLLLHSPLSTAFEGRFAIDSLYSTIFADGYSMIYDEDEFSTLRSVIGIVVLAMDPLSVQSIGRLLNCGIDDITSLLRPLHAVLKIPKEDKSPIQYYHKSFQDFVTDASRCRDSKFFIDPPAHHLNLAFHCLGLMNMHLRKNICSLPRYAMNSDMPINQRRKLIGGALDYACCFWADHLIATPATQISHLELWSLPEVFLKQKQILWFEVMSLVENLGRAITSLDRLHNWLKTILDDESDMRNVVTSLVDWVNEGKWFIHEFRTCIEASACHLYHSALPLSPADSMLRALHAHDLEGEVNVLHGLERHWNASSAVVHTFDGDVGSVKFSHDGSILAVAAKEAVHIFNAATGERLQTIHTPDNTCAMDFSPNDSLLVTAGSEGHVHLWDLQTGSFIRTHSEAGFIHVDYVCVMFSPSGKKIALSHKTALFVWDTETGNLESFLQLETVRSKKSILGMHWMGDDPEKLLLKIRWFTDKYHLGVWELAGLRKFEGPRLGIQADSGDAVSVGHSLIAVSVTDDMWKSLEIYSLETLTLLTTILRSDPGINNRGRVVLSFSPIRPSGKVFLFWDGLVLDASNTDQIIEVALLTSPVAFVDFSSFSSITAVAVGSIIRMWAFEMGNLDITNPYPHNVDPSRYWRAPSELHISQNGTTIVYESTTHFLKVFLHGTKVSTEEIRRDLDAFSIQIGQDTFRSSIAISPDNIRFMAWRSIKDKDSCYEVRYGRLPNHGEHLGGLTYESCISQYNVIDYFSDTAAVSLHLYNPGTWKDRCLRFGRMWLRVILMEDPMDGFAVDHNYDTTGKGGGWTDFRHWLRKAEEIPSISYLVRGLGSPGLANWIEVESGSILRIHNRGSSGHWRTSIKNGSSTFELIHLPSSHNSALATHLETLKTWPVLSSSGKAWIYNSDGQAILWIHPRAEGAQYLYESWRWRGRQLILAGDHLVIGKLFIFDFTDVDVIIPSPAETYRKEKFKTVTLSGLNLPWADAGNESGSCSDKQAAGGYIHKNANRCGKDEGGDFVDERGGGSSEVKEAQDRFEPPRDYEAGTNGDLVESNPKITRTSEE